MFLTEIAKIMRDEKQKKIIEKVKGKQKNAALLQAPRQYRVQPFQGK